MFHDTLKSEEQYLRGLEDGYPTVENLVYIGSVDTDICKSEASPSQTQMISMGSSPRLLSKHM